MIEYVILGTSHCVQESNELEQAVLGAAAEYGVALIAEENTYDIASTSARRAANWQGVPYLQVDPSPAEWFGLAIDREMSLREQCLQRQDVRLSHADSVREDFWLGRIEAVLDRGHVLVICGYLHVNFLGQKVEARGDKVL